MARIGIRVAFAGLVVATVVASFINQRLKRTLPVVSGVEVVPKYFSPNGDGHQDRVRLSFLIKRADDVTVSVVDTDGDEVKRLATDMALTKGRQIFTWSGRSNSGTRLPDGVYFLRVGLRREGRTATTARKIFLDTRPPRPVVASVSPDVLAPSPGGGKRLVRVRFHGPTRRRPDLLIYRTGVERARLVAKVAGTRRSPIAFWDGMVRGKPAPAGNYLMAVRVWDRAGNVGTGPPRLPPRRSETRGHPGLVVSSLAVIPPLTALGPGRRASFRIRAGLPSYRSRLPALSPFRWRVRRLGSARVIKRGRTGDDKVEFEAPRGRPGVYLLEVRAGGRLVQTPLAVRSTSRRRVLLVLSTTTWQALNPVDSNNDGWADVLARERSVPLERPFAQGLPPGFAIVESPLLKWLDRQGLRYEVTTDLALERGNGPKLEDHRAVVFSGTQKFPTASLIGSVRKYVRRGGRVALLGTGSFQRKAELNAHRLENPVPLGSKSSFGEVLRTVHYPIGPVVSLTDRIGLFEGVPGNFGVFSTLEEEVEPPPGRSLASAGRDEKRPSLVLFRFGRGLVFRSGSSEWNRNLRSSPEVERIMRRLWTLLSR